jgi:T5orf172 domain
MSTPKNSVSAMDAILEDPEFAEIYGQRKQIITPSTEDTRIIAGFEEISSFVDTNGAEPTEGTDFALAARLETLREDDRLKALLVPYDRHALLGQTAEAPLPTTMDEIVALEDPIFDTKPSDGMFELVHVTERRDYTYADDTAERARCEKFDTYRPMFERLSAGLHDRTLATKREIENTERRKGVKSTVLGLTDLKPGAAFILNGIIAYIVERREGLERTVNKVKDAHLHIVFDNGTEARDYLARSFARVLFEDPNGRQIIDAKSGLPVNIDPAHGDLPMFGGNLQLGPEDQQTGTLYIVESLSTDPQIAELRGRLYKIGFTTQKIELRLANVETDATFLFAPVKLVAHYTIANARPAAVEKLIHDFFAPARLNIILHLGRKVEPREWFVVPLEQIRAAVPRIQDRTIVSYRYDRGSQRIVRK